MLRDLVGWDAVLDYIATLPKELARHVRVMELECLADRQDWCGDQGCRSSRGPHRQWVRPTLPGIAFDRGDVAEAQRLLPQVAAEGTAAWKIRTTLSDLEKSAGSHPDETVRRQLSGILYAYRELIPAAPADGAAEADREQGPP